MSAPREAPNLPSRAILVALALLSCGSVARADEPSAAPTDAVATAEPATAPTVPDALSAGPSAAGLGAPAPEAAEPEAAERAPAPAPVDRRPNRRCALCGDERSYDVELAIPLWVPFVSGQLATGQLDTSNPDSSWGKRLSMDSSLLFFFFGRLAARYGPSGLLIDSAGATFAEDISFTLTDGEIAKLSASAFLVRSAFTYRTPPIRLGHRERPFLMTFVPYGGMRFVRITLDWTGIAAEFSRHQLWVDPIVGTRIHLDFRNGLTFYVEGDVGGFTAGSTIAGWASAVIEYAFVDWFALGAGWNYYRFRQDIPAGDRSLDAAITVTGPQLTLSFHLR